MALSISVKFNKRNLKDWIKFQGDRTAKQANKGIGDYMNNVLLDQARDVHPWQHRTWTLYHGHYVEKLDGNQGWALVADPYHDPQIDPETGETKVVKEDYAWILETSPQWTWFWNAYLNTSDRLIEAVKLQLDE